MSIAPRISNELGIGERSVLAVLGLLEDGATVPFIARYRKEVTLGLDEVQIRAITERRGVLLELDKRRASILDAIAEQGALTDALRGRINSAQTRAELEDLYLPYKKKRKTRASVAIERGLEPLAKMILTQSGPASVIAEARRFVRGEVMSTDDALAGARDIAAERIAEDAAIRALVREQCQRWGVLRSKAARGKKDERSKYEQYYDFSEPVGRVASHRFLAVSRGEREGFLSVKVEVDDERLMQRVLRDIRHDRRSPWGAQLEEAATDAMKRLALPSVEREVRATLKEDADTDAVRVFANNLEQLLLSPPVGPRSMVGIDPGIRTGCKCVAVDATGRYLDQTTIYPVRDEARACEQVDAFIARHKPYAVAVGNGTYGRETLALVRDAIANRELDAIAVEVSEAGASVYSASELAGAELPDLDVTVRGAVSIARRLQDPLAELVKIEPRSIGVGQYQHDIKPALLERKLTEVVESCVNRVGVELNTASPALLSYVAGIGPKLADRIVAHRDKNGQFKKRTELKKVAGLGAKTFEQAAGFLRVRDGSDPLDASAVHPERYALVGTIARDLGARPADLIGNQSLVSRIQVARYIGPDVGEPTLLDIVAELARPGRDPRPPFQPPERRADVRTLEDLREGMVLPGVVTNVTTFGAFVDIGVKQDGLVHVSELANRFIRDPAEAATVGQRMPVKVLSVDLQRKRISLSAKQAT